MDETEKVHQGEGDVGEDQKQYLQHLQQKEEDEDDDEGWGDEESGEENQEVVQSSMEAGDSRLQSEGLAPAVPGLPPPPPPSVSSPAKGVKLRIKKNPADTPPPPPSPGPPPPTPPSVSAPAKSVKLRVKSQPGDAPPPPPSPGPPPLLSSVTAPAKSVKLRVKSQPGDAPPPPTSPGPPPSLPSSVTAPVRSVKLRVRPLPGDAPPPPPSPGSPPSLLSSVTAPAKGVRLKVREKTGEDLPPPPSPGPPPPLPPSVSSPRKIKYKTKTKAAPENLSPDHSEITSNDHKQQHQPTPDHDIDTGKDSIDNTDNTDQRYSKDEQDYEADSPIRRSYGYNNLNGNAEDQQAVYINGDVAVSPDSEGQSPTWAAEQNGYDFPDGFSEDQKQAMAELQQLRLDLDYAEEDPPQYNVAARLRQLNEELAQEADPDDDRERSIKFKEDLVDLVAPPPEYPSDEEGTSERVGDSNETEPPESPNRNNDEYEEDFEENADSPKNSDNKGFNENCSQPMADNKRLHNGNHIKDNKSGAPTSVGKRTNVKNKDESSDDKILVEREGTFELLYAKDLTAEERQLYLPQITNEEDEADTGRSSASFEPAPPKDPRPSTAAASSGRRRVTSAAPRRVQSAQPKRVENKPVLEDFHYTSPYALSDQQKRVGKEQKKALADREKRQRELAKMEEREKNRENNEAFQAWLSHKRREIASKRKEEKEKEKEQKKTDEEKKKEREESGAFEAWLKHKKEQKRREKEEERKRREYDEGWHDKEKDNSQKAFKQWLKKKREDSKNNKVLERQRVRIHKLMVRRSHKALQLARAIRQSQSFNYVDYYGYRY